VFKNCRASTSDGYGGGICGYFEDFSYKYLFSSLTFSSMDAKYGKHIYINVDNLPSVAGKQFAGIYILPFFLIMLLFFVLIINFFFFLKGVVLVK
jgi:hypothetical protein